MRLGQAYVFLFLDAGTSFWFSLWCCSTMVFQDVSVSVSPFCLVGVVHVFVFNFFVFSFGGSAYQGVWFFLFPAVGGSCATSPLASFFSSFHESSGHFLLQRLFSPFAGFASAPCPRQIPSFPVKQPAGLNPPFLKPKTPPPPPPPLRKRGRVTERILRLSVL